MIDFITILGIVILAAINYFLLTPKTESKSRNTIRVHKPKSIDAESYFTQA